MSASPPGCIRKKAVTSYTLVPMSTQQDSLVRWQATSRSVKDRGDVDGDILTNGDANAPAWKPKTQKRGRRERTPRATVDLVTAPRVPAQRLWRRGVARGRFKTSGIVPMGAVDDHRGAPPAFQIFELQVGKSFDRLRFRVFARNQSIFFCLRAVERESCVFGDVAGASEPQVSVFLNAASRPDATCCPEKQPRLQMRK